MLQEQDLTRRLPAEAPSASALFASLDDTTLIQLVLEAVHEFEPSLPPTMPRGHRSYNPAQTTTLLAYCYGRGIYGSEEIESRLPEDTAIRYICAGSKPDCSWLRRFRRDNSLLILGVLTRLLELVATQAGVATTAVIPDRWRDCFREEAMNRLRDAIHADSAAQDL